MRTSGSPRYLLHCLPALRRGRLSGGGSCGFRGGLTLVHLCTFEIRMGPDAHRKYTLHLARVLKAGPKSGLGRCAGLLISRFRQLRPRLDRSALLIDGRWFESITVTQTPASRGFFVGSIGPICCDRTAAGEHHDTRAVYFSANQINLALCERTTAQPRAPPESSAVTALAKGHQQT